MQHEAYKKQFAETEKPMSPMKSPDELMKLFKSMPPSMRYEAIQTEKTQQFNAIGMEGWSFLGDILFSELFQKRVDEAKAAKEIW